MKVELLRELWAQDLKQLFTAEAGVKEALRRILEASSLGELHVESPDPSGSLASAGQLAQGNRR